VSEFETDTARRLRELVAAMPPLAASDDLLLGAHHLARRRRGVLLAATAAAIVLLVTTVAAVAVDNGPHRAAPVTDRTPVPHDEAPYQVLRLDNTHLLVISGSRFDVLDPSGRTRALTRPWKGGGVGGIMQAFVSGRSWYLLASDCQTAGLNLVRSDDDGRSWSASIPVGYVNCSGFGQVHTVGRRLVLVTKEDNAPDFAMKISEDGTHWPQRAQRSDSGAGSFAAQQDGSYVRIWGEDGMVHAPSLLGPEKHVALPAKAQPLRESLGSADGRYVVLSTVGVPYTSSDGVTWTPHPAPFPGCACTRLRLTVLSATTWWTQAWDGHQSRYAVTTDAGSSWRLVPGPPGADVMYPNDLIPWNDTSVVVQRVGVPWISYDLGKRWQRLDGATSPAPSTSPVSSTDMHAVEAPGALTSGTADVDGDGRPDRVTVSATTGGVALELAGGPTLRAALPFADNSARLQALPDLFHTGHRAVLVYSSAAGCCGYAPTESQSYVLVLDRGRLELVRDTHGEPLRVLFTAGRGQLYGSIQCRAAQHEVVQRAIQGTDPQAATETETTITLHGATANVSTPAVTQLNPWQEPASFPVAQGCPGLTDQGRATP
jgi:hypothetical protein